MSDKLRHPCFNPDARDKHARVHLPVAPKCNLQCNYCDRKFDCVNESRPGVTSAVLSPRQALAYLDDALVRCPEIAVVGIAGPGDPFANAAETLETLRLIKDKHPEMLFCLSSNGLELEPHIDTILDLGVTHVTVTVNAVDPLVASRIYAWARFQKRVYRGLDAAKLLLERQTSALRVLKAKGATIKLNTVIIPGVNDAHAKDVAAFAKELGVDLMNCIPVAPSPDTAFGSIPEPSHEDIAKLRSELGFMTQMTHCARCRADAVGLLGRDRPDCLAALRAHAFDPKPHVAVASHEGLLVNQHLGEAESLHIFGEDADGAYTRVELRPAPAPGGGDDRWLQLATSLGDCRALLVGGLGDKPLAILEGQGIKVLEMSGLIEDGLDSVFKSVPFKHIRPRDLFKCGSGCSGSGAGCG